MKNFSRQFTNISVLLCGVGAVALSSTAHAQMPAWEPDLVPSGAVAGNCYARVEVPATYNTSEETVVVEEGYSKIEVSQPQLRSRQEQVMVKEASVRYEVTQPRFKTVSERVMVRPAYDKLSVSQPEFRTVTETVATSAPRMIWKRGNPTRLRAQGYRVHSTADDRARPSRGVQRTGQGGVQFPMSHCGETCEIWCLVEEPGQSTSFNRKVMTSPGAVRRIPVPAKYTSVSKQVIAHRGGVREIPVPPQYRGITVEEVVSPGGERRVEIPAKYGKVAKKTLATPGRYEWRRVVCKPGTLRGSARSSHAAPVRRSSSAHSYNSSGHHTGGVYSSGGSHSSGSVQSSSGYSAGHAPITYGDANGTYSGSNSGSGTTTHSYSSGHSSSHGAHSTHSSHGAPRYTSGHNTTYTPPTSHAVPVRSKKTYYYGTNKPVNE